MRAFIGLGSNVGDRRAWLCRGLEALAGEGLPPLAVSSVWETEPVDCPDPEWFLNLVALVHAARPPRELLETLLAIERRAGRVRRARNEPRVLDLDLLLHGDLHLEEPGLVLPHPRMWERRFVLAPLAELAPSLRNPESGRTVVEELSRLSDPSVVRRVGALAPAGDGSL